MRHIHIVSRYKMRWVVPMAKSLSGTCRVTAATLVNPDENPDVIIFAWADDIARDYINNVPKGDKKYIVMLRSFEYMEPWWLEIDWSKVDDVICVNDYIAGIVEQEIGRKPHIIYNAVEMDKWKFRDRKPGKNIAMVCHVHYKKNHALAMQILATLPDDYVLHCAGDVQCPDIVNYMDVISKATGRKVYVYGHIPENQLDLWLEDKHYLLSCSVREGSPNNVIEAMAKGIKPVVHNWPGAIDQFYPYTFNTVDEAVRMITEDHYDSGEYRRVVEDNYGPENYKKLIEIVEGLWTSLSV